MNTIETALRSYRHLLTHKHSEELKQIASATAAIEELNVLQSRAHAAEQKVKEVQKNYYDVADALAKESTSPAHLCQIARDLRAQLQQVQAERDATTTKPWCFCPECGSTEIRHEEGHHKQCNKCHQEWFSDVDYTAEVQINLGKRAASDLHLTTVLAALPEVEKAVSTAKETFIGLGDYSSEGPPNVEDDVALMESALTTLRSAIDSARASAGKG